MGNTSFDAPLYRIPGLTASADLTLLQHRFVIVSASEQVNVAGVAASAIGVLQNKPNTGQAAEVVAAGVSNVIASAAITAGTDLATAANGKVAAATAGQNVVGKAIQAASNDDDIISALIFFATSAAANFSASLSSTPSSFILRESSRISSRSSSLNSAIINLQVWPLLRPVSSSQVRPQPCRLDRSATLFPRPAS